MSIFRTRSDHATATLAVSPDATSEVNMTESVDISEAAPVETSASAGTGDDRNRIDVSNLHIYYGDFLAVEDVSMTINPRSITGCSSDLIEWGQAASRGGGDGGAASKEASDTSRRSSRSSTAWNTWTAEQAPGMT